MDAGLTFSHWDKVWCQRRSLSSLQHGAPKSQITKSTVCSSKSFYRCSLKKEKLRPSSFYALHFGVEFFLLILTEGNQFGCSSLRLQFNFLFAAEKKSFFSLIPCLCITWRKLFCIGVQYVSGYHQPANWFLRVGFCSLEHVSFFLSFFFLFFLLWEEKQNNFTHTHSKMYCCVAMFWWWEWEIA